MCVTWRTPQSIVFITHAYMCVYIYMYDVANATMYCGHHTCMYVCVYMYIHYYYYY